MTIRGRDSRGFTFEETTSSENLCRSGAAFLVRRDVPPGTDIEIRIPFSVQVRRHPEPDFTTQGRVVHVGDELACGGRMVGVQFIGPRFHRVFRPEA